MRGEATRQAKMMLAITPDQLIPADHPIRAIKAIVDTALAELSPVFNEIYARTGRPSIPPEHLLKGRLLMELFSVPAPGASATSSSTTCSSNGSSISTSTTPPSTPQPSQRTRTACSVTPSPSSFSAPWFGKRTAGTCCPRITSRSTARCWRRGRR